MDNSWQCVYYSNQLHKIEIVKAVLEDQNIKSVVVDKRDSNYIAVGDIEVYVPNEDAILAKIIIGQNEL
jgi:hypothetical protein